MHYFFLYGESDVVEISFNEWLIVILFLLFYTISKEISIGRNLSKFI